MLWILVYLTTAGQPAVTEPMPLKSCIALLERPGFEQAFCFAQETPKLIVRRKGDGHGASH